jgi:hypothetical protein
MDIAIDHRMRTFKGHLGIANLTTIRDKGPPLKLYLLTQQLVTGPGTYDSCVVVAPNEDAARCIHPFRDSRWGDDCMWGLSSWVLPEDIHHVTVTEVGTASEYLAEGMVVCASYNDD